MLKGPGTAKLSRGSFFAFLVAAILVVPSVSSAIVGWGPQGGFSITPDQIVLGAHVDVGELAPSIELRASADVGFGDNVFVFTANGDAVYLVSLENSRWAPFVGGGLTIAYLDFDIPDIDTDIPGVGTIDIDSSTTEVGLSIVGGVSTVLSGGHELVLTGRLGIGDIPDFKVIAGWTF